MTSLVRRAWPFCLVALAGLLVATPVPACPFCNQQGQTLTGEIAQASMVLYGSLTNQKLGEKGEQFEGTTDLVIEQVIKAHDVLGSQKVIKLNRYLPPEPAGKYKYLVFCDVFKGRVDPYRGVAVKADSDMPAYLKGVIALKTAPTGKRLRFFFDFLDNADAEVSNDALKEFANADYKDYRDMAKGLPPEKIAAWLKDPKTPPFRYGLYASLLGHCGKPEHAALLRSMLEDPEKRVSSGIDGIMAAYTMLQSKEGFAYIQDVLKDAKKEFLVRYAALRAVRFFWDSRPDLVTRRECAEAAGLLLDQSDIADLAIEDLRKWERWDMAGRILALKERDAYDVPIVRRAILRYALSAKGNAPAARYVEEQRKKDAQSVTDAEELLKLEQPRPAPPKQAGS
jgi:hypothetical protein